MSTPAERIREAIEREEETIVVDTETGEIIEQETETGDVTETESAAPAAPPAQPVPAASPEAQAELQKQVENKVKNYKAGMVKLLEQLPGEWFESPFDDLPGFVLPFDPDTAEGQQKRTMADLYFDQGAHHYAEHPTQRRCDKCDGYGRMDNGAREPNTTWALCWACHGSGTRDLTMPEPQPPVAYVGLAVAPPPAAPQPWQPQPTPAAPAPERLDPPHGWHASGSPGADQWARWPGHPRFGIDPALSGW